MNYYFPAAAVIYKKLLPLDKESTVEWYEFQDDFDEELTLKIPPLHDGVEGVESYEVDEELGLKTTHLRDRVEGEKMNITVLVAGRSGTGKHTLVKSFFGERDLESDVEIRSPLTGFRLVLEKVSTIVMIWSSPGLYDNFFNDEDKVKTMKELVNNLDIFLYTMRMDDTRLRPEDVLTLQQLSGAFGSKLWGKCVFVLTFANRVDYLDARQMPQRNKEHFTKRAMQWENHIREILENKGIPRSVVEEIPIVPAGHHSQLRLFTDEESWLRQLVRAVVKRVNDDVKPAIPILTSFYDHG